jgi:hypothetical protein
MLGQKSANKWHEYVMTLFANNSPFLCIEEAAPVHIWHHSIILLRPIHRTESLRLSP